MPAAADAGQARERDAASATRAGAGRLGWTLAAAAVLGLALWGILRQGQRAALPPDLAAAGLAYPFEVDGRAVGGAGELAFAAQRRRPGDELALPAPAPPARLDAELTTAGSVLTLLSALVHAALLAFVVAPRAEQAAARALGRGLACACLGIALGGVYPAVAPGDAVLTVLYVLALSGMPVEFALLALTFPRRSPWLVRLPRLSALLRAVALAVAAWGAWAWLGYDAAGTSEAWARVQRALRAQQALLVLGMAGGCAALVASARAGAPRHQREQARWLLWGIAVAATPFVFLRVLPRLLGVAELPIPPEVDRLVELAAPAAFAIAVVRHQLFDIDAVIRRSLIATTLALLLAGAALVVLLLLGSLVPAQARLPREAVGIAAGAAAVLLFLPGRRWVGRWVDRVLFRIQHEHGRALAELDAALARAETLVQARGAAQHALAEQLEPQPLTVWLDAGPVDGAEPAPVAPALLPSLADGRLRARPDATTAPTGTLLPLAGPLEGLPAGVHLLQPAAGSGRVWALLLLGPKASKHRYVEEDLAFLEGVAGRTARACERLHLLRSLEAASQAREALAALDGQRREFLLRVAHDLRTPLTAVRWSAENLRDRVGGALNATQEDQVADILAAGGRLTRLVENLVALSRTEMGDRGSGSELVALGPLISEAVASQRALARAKGVDLVLRVEDPPPVRARRDGLSQVLQNLLDNAIKYAPPGTPVEIGARHEPSLGGAPGGGVRLWVRDHGAGFGGKDPASLFELFRQGAPSAHAAAKGFGVGLHVVKSWVEAFGGSVGAREPEGGGAQFECQLPLWGATGGQA